MFNFHKKGLNCSALNTKAFGRQEQEYGKNAKITELKIEDIKYSQAGHLTNDEIENWADEILENQLTDPELWKLEEPEYDRWGRLVKDRNGNWFDW